MRQTGSEHLTDEELVANALALAERWERTLANGGGHKLADRPDRSRKAKSHSGPQRPARWYDPTVANGDLWYLVESATGKRHKVASYSVSPAHYGDDYGTGRHYAAVEAQSDVIASPDRHRLGATGQGIRMILNPLGEYEYRYDVWPGHPEYGQMIVGYDRPAKSERKSPTRKTRLGRKPKKYFDDGPVDDSALFYDGTSAAPQWQKTE